MGSEPVDDPGVAVSGWCFEDGDWPADHGKCDGIIPSLRFDLAGRPCGCSCHGSES